MNVRKGGVFMADVRNLIIIGSGPGGLTAAIYSSRASLEPLVIEGLPSSTVDTPGGQLMTTTDVENYPGFPDGIQGPELMSQMRDQAKRFGTEFVSGKVKKVDFSVQPFRLWTDDEEFSAKTVIISTGAQSVLLGLESEQRLLGHGVSTCATCDGFFFRGKEVVVVGGGDAALEEAIFLTKFATKVNLVHRRDALRASKIMQDRAFANPKISFVWNSEVAEILGDQKVEGVRLKSTVGKSDVDMPIGGVFISIGHRPSTDVFKGQVELDAKNYIVTHDGMKTSVPGVFACGDVQDSIYRQAVTSAGAGCMASIDAEHYLQHLNGSDTTNN
jgi:thioredoxin reductase (NADPH)